jgi:CheY-like chemotaxis protein
MEQKRMTLAQAARLAGVSEDELRCAVVNGQLGGGLSDSSGVFLIDPKSLEAYLKTLSHAPAGDERRRVLIVDDEINFGNLLKLDLQRDRRVVARFATWGRDGVRMAREFRPHVLLLDFMLPETTGEEVLKELQELHRTGRTRVIVYSAHSARIVEQDPGLRQRLAALGADEFISKDVGLRSLVRRVKEVLGLEPAAA